MVSSVGGPGGGADPADFGSQSDGGPQADASSAVTASTVDLGKATRHPAGAVVPDHRSVDNFNADYVGNKDLGKAMKDLSAAYHKDGISMTPELEGKINAVSDAMGITREEGMRNHARLADAFIESRQAPPMNPDLAVKNQEAYASRMPPAPQIQDDFWASGTQLGAGYLAGKSLGTNPVWGSLFSTSMGLTGPGSNYALHLSEDTFAKMPGDGFWAGAYNALASVGNFFTDAIGDHSKIHDVYGHLHTKFGFGPGYTYAPGAIPPKGNFTTGQVSGTLYSVGRKTADLVSDAAQSAWSGVSSAASAVADTAKDVASGVAGYARDAWSGISDTAAVAVDKAKDVAGDIAGFGRDAWSGVSNAASAVADTAKDVAGGIAGFGRDAWSGIGNAASAVADTAKDVAGDIADFGRDAWSGVKDTIGFGDDSDVADTTAATQEPEKTTTRTEKQERGDEPSVRSERNDPQMDSNDVRDSGSF